MPSGLSNDTYYPLELKNALHDLTDPGEGYIFKEGIPTGNLISERDYALAALQTDQEQDEELELQLEFKSDTQFKSINLIFKFQYTTFSIQYINSMFCVQPALRKQTVTSVYSEREETQLLVISDLDNTKSVKPSITFPAVS